MTRQTPPKQLVDPTELIGLPSIARVLKCTRMTARSYVLEQRFQAWKIDGRFFALRSAVLDYLSSASPRDQVA